MPVHLLDVNVLIALGWPNNKHHDSARRWFASIAAGDAGGNWATCPLTQCAFVRISTNPKAVGAALTPAQAVAAIARMTAHEHHVFWADDLPLASPYFPAAALQGHQQITDAYLLALCASRGGRLATFDTAIGAIAGDSKLVTNVPT
jgi:toxin-antitoxin system PIN domain toxin